MNDICKPQDTHTWFDRAEYVDRFAPEFSDDGPCSFYFLHETKSKTQMMIFGKSRDTHTWFDRAEYVDRFAPEFSGEGPWHFLFHASKSKTPMIFANLEYTYLIRQSRIVHPELAEMLLSGDVPTLGPHPSMTIVLSGETLLNLVRGSVAATGHFASGC